MTLNITCDMLQEEMITIAHKALVIPPLIISYLSFVFIFLIVGLCMIDGSKGAHPYQKFMWIWIISIIITGIIVAFLIYSPNAVQAILTKISEFWS